MSFLKSIMAVCLVGCSITMSAGDNGRAHQVLSMETPGYWNFQRGGIDGKGGLLGSIGSWLYKNNPQTKVLRAILPYSDNQFYESTNKDYSGYSGGAFFELRSKNAVNISLLRSALSLMQQERLEDALTVNDTITPVFNEHLLLMADRNIDMYYVTVYRDQFEELGGDISNHLAKVMRVSKGRLKDDVERLEKEFRLVCAQVEYLHKTGGASTEIHNAQRQEGYEDCKERLQSIAKRSEYLANITEQLYNINPNL